MRTIFYHSKKAGTDNDVWDVKHKPTPGTNDPPTESFFLYDESSSSSADDYIIDVNYPIENYI